LDFKQLENYRRREIGFKITDSIEKIPEEAMETDSLHGKININPKKILVTRLAKLILEGNIIFH